MASSIPSCNKPGPFPGTVQRHPKLNPPLGCLFVNLQLQLIKLDCDKRIKHKNCIQAVHFWCNADFCTTTELALKAMWNKTVFTGETKDLPDRQRLKFIPSNSNCNDRRAAGKLCLAQSRSRLEQRKFLEEHKSVEILGVRDLDMPCNVPQTPDGPSTDTIPLTLQQALLTSKTSCNLACPLFLAVDHVQTDN